MNEKKSSGWGSRWPSTERKERPAEPEQSGLAKGNIERSSEAVGYGRPPKHTQFKKGKSGNPNGRPRQSLTQQAVAAKVLNENRTVEVNGEVKKMSNRELLFRKTLAVAQKGVGWATKQVNALDAEQSESLSPFKHDELKIVLVRPDKKEAELLSEETKRNRSKD